MNIKQRIKNIGLSLLLSASPLASSAQTEAKSVNESSNKETVINPKERDRELELVLGNKARYNRKNKKYTYIPLSKDDFLNMAQRAVEILQNTTEKNDLCDKLCSFYENIKDKEIDLDDPVIRKTFLAYKKIVKTGKLSADSRSGIYDEQSYLLGIDAKSFHKLTKTASNNVRNFCEQIYSSDVFKMINNKDAPEAEKIAEQLLKEKLEAYNIAAQDTSFSYNALISAVYLCDLDNEFNNWNLQLSINSNQFDATKGVYCPLAIVKAHELGHIMQIMPGAQKDYSERLAELAPTLDMIDMLDKVYKKIHNIPLEEEVDYSFASTKVDFGKIANTFRNIKKEKNLRSYEDVLLTPEANKAINKFVTQKIAMNNLSKSISDNLMQK